jgi:hypothetical protein
MRFSTLVFVIVACSSANFIICKDDNVKISVYYESLCPDSARFITGQLSNAFREVISIVDIKFMPFGKANVNIHPNPVWAQFLVETPNNIFRYFSIQKTVVVPCGIFNVNMAKMSVLVIGYM